MKLKIEIDRDHYDYRWSIDGNKFGESYDKTIPGGFGDTALVDQGWEEVVAFNGSIFYTYNGANYAEGIEKSRGIVNQDWDTDFNTSMAIGCDYDGNVIFDSQANIKAKLNNYYGAITGCFGIYKDYSKWPLGVKENDSQFTTRSGRTVLGFDGKDYYVISQAGETGKSGFTGAELYNECKGMKDAICFDGGGSVWCRYFGKYINVTTRRVKNAVILYRKKKANAPESDDKVAVKKVIDISSHQPNVDYAKVKATGVNGVIIRCGRTYWGNIIVAGDSAFEKHYQGFKAVGMPVGVYYYSAATTIAKAKEEAQFVLKVLKGKKLEYPVYFDVENKERQQPLSTQLLTDITKAFCETIEKNGYYVGIYASTSWLNNELDMNQLKNYDVWVAQYNSKCTYGGKYGMWQYTDKALVDGIPTEPDKGIDMSYCYKDYPTIIKNAKLNGYGVEPEPDYKALYTEVKANYDNLVAEHAHCAEELENSANETKKLQDKLDNIKKIIEG